MNKIIPPFIFVFILNAVIGTLLFRPFGLYHGMEITIPRLGWFIALVSVNAILVIVFTVISILKRKNKPAVYITLAVACLLSPLAMALPMFTIVPYLNEQAESEKRCVPLMYIKVLTGDINYVQRELNQGVDVNSQTKDGDTLLHYATTYNRPEIARMLLAMGADVKIKTHQSDTVLHLAAYHSNTALLQMYIDSGADLDAVGYSRQGPLHRAALVHATASVKLLVENGAAIDVEDKDGMTPLHHAVSGYDLEMSQYLISKGANFHTINNRGRTLLHTHAWPLLNHTKLLELLLSLGIDPEIKDTKGKTALDYAIERNNEVTIELIKRRMQ